jgi:hypothetical protein
MASEEIVVGLQVLQASYGVFPSNTIDVTKETQALVKDGNLNFTVSPQAFGIIDPAPGVKKTFQASISINDGKPTILMKDDGEVFDLSAPTINKKEKPNHAGALGTSIFYFLISVIGVYFSFSAYKLGVNGLKSQILGLILGTIVLGGFVSFGAADVGVGIIGLLFSTPLLISSLLLIVFLILCYDLNYIDFSYLNAGIPMTE